MPLLKSVFDLSGREQAIREREKELSERAAAIDEKAKKAEKSFLRSREYRLMLRDYQQELRQREKGLITREEELLLREDALKTLQQDIVDHATKDVRVEAEQTKALLSELQTREHELRLYEQELKTIEYNALIAIRRWEKKEFDFFSDLRSEYDKLLSNPSIAIKRNGYKFEEYVAELLRANGYENVEVTKKSGDFGGDIVAEKAGQKYIFQCKYQSSTVGVNAVYEVCGSVKVYNADIAVVVTNNIFSTPAKQLANANDVLLLDCSDLARMNVDGQFFT